MNRRKEIINIRAEINDVETKKIKINLKKKQKLMKPRASSLKR